jgi:hypothetical protein
LLRASSTLQWIASITILGPVLKYPHIELAREFHERKDTHANIFDPPAFIHTRDRSFRLGRGGVEDLDT